MNWSSAGLKLTIGIGALGAVGVWADWLDMPKGDFWTGFLPMAVLTLGPFAILVFVRRGEVSNRTAWTAHLIAALWYGGLIAATVGLMAWRGFQPSDLVMGAFMALGVWPCVDLLRAPRWDDDFGDDEDWTL